MPQAVVERTCQCCGNLFHPRLAEVNRGKGRYCSVACRRKCKPRKSLMERFLAGIGETTPTGCILWGTGERGTMCSGGKAGSKGSVMMTVPRVAYQLFVGPIPNGMFVCHRCDNPACVNHEHLFLGTQTDNLADMTAKGRRMRGEKQGRSKLTEDNVREIRRRSEAGESREALAAEFGTCPTNISHIVHRKNWAHVV